MGWLFKTVDALFRKQEKTRRWLFRTVVVLLALLPALLSAQIYSRFSPICVMIVIINLSLGILIVVLLETIQKQRWQVETVLSQAKEQFRSIFETAPDGIMTADREGRIVLVNDRIMEIFGYSGEELIGRPIEVLVPERFREDHVRQRRDFSAKPRRRPMGSGLNNVGRRKDGTEFPAGISLSPFRGGPDPFRTAVLCHLPDR